MAPLTSIDPLRRYERGGVSWVTLLILATVVGAIYLAIVWVPVFVAHYGVKQTVRDYMNQAIKNPNDELLVANLCAKLATLETVTRVGPDGNAVREPAVVVAPGDVTWERDVNSTPKMLHVAFEYTREVQYPFLDKQTEWVGTIDLSNELTIPDWGPAR